MLSEKDLQKQCIAYMKLKNIVYTHQGNEFIRYCFNKIESSSFLLDVGSYDTLRYMHIRLKQKHIYEKIENALSEEENKYFNLL